MFDALYTNGLFSVKIQRFINAIDFAHSPPFNQVNMVLLLIFISFATGMIYFFGRNIYAAIIFHNTLALFGVMQALEKSDNLITYSQPIYPLIVMAIISVIILAASDIIFIRRKVDGIK
jgi:hypothetical protein